MRDPRLAEIEFLSALERSAMWIRVRHEPDAVGQFGLSAEATRGMLFEMIAEQLVNGPATALTVDQSGQNPIDEAQMFAFRDSTQMQAGTLIEYRITHKGRLRLWRLRDELRADRGREQFGILYDRRAWDRELAVQSYFATNDEPLSIAFIDLDHFKTVNDTISHDEGDRVLKRSMEIVRDMVGDRGDAYRIGGDELGAVMPKTALAESERIAEGIRRAVEEEFRAAEIPVTASIGVAEFVAVTDPTVASKFADGKMYEAKHAGRNCVRAGRFLSGV